MIAVTLWRVSSPNRFDDRSYASGSGRDANHSRVEARPSANAVRGAHPIRSRARETFANQSVTSHARGASANSGEASSPNIPWATDARSRIVVLTPVPIFTDVPCTSGRIERAARTKASQTSSTWMKSREISGLTNGG